MTLWSLSLKDSHPSHLFTPLLGDNHCHFFRWFFISFTSIFLSNMRPRLDSLVTCYYRQWRFSLLYLFPTLWKSVWHHFLLRSVPSVHIRVMSVLFPYIPCCTIFHFLSLTTSVFSGNNNLLLYSFAWFSINSSRPDRHSFGQSTHPSGFGQPASDGSSMPHPYGHRSWNLLGSWLGCLSAHLFTVTLGIPLASPLSSSHCRPKLSLSWLLFWED